MKGESRMYLGFFFLTFVISLFLTPLVSRLMKRWRIVDEPRAEERKIHRKKIPLGGGLAIFASFFLVALSVGGKMGISVEAGYLWALFLGGLILMLGGLLDDKYNLSAGKQLIAPVAAALVIIAFGIGPEAITSPFGGVFDFSRFAWGDWLWLADLLLFIWLMVMMFTTKLLDGLDGLTAGIVCIGALMIAFLSLQAKWYQPDLALLAFIFSGAVLGFLAWNWHPAKIFLGEGGSLFLGFMLGCLAVISGGKIATTLLVMGVPMLDMARVIIRRLQKGRPIYLGDSEHLHFRLLRSGLTQRQAVLLLYSLAFLFGLTTLFLQSRQKLMALAFLFVLMLLAGVWFGYKENGA